VPNWAKHSSLRGWAFSVVGADTDHPVAPGRWVSGNHFWFRNRCLPTGFQFETSKRPEYIEMTEPKLMLDLAEAGWGGVIASDAKAVHRLQPELLDEGLLRSRASRVGRGFAEARLIPFRSSVKQAVLFRSHPFLARLFCMVSIARWSWSYAFWSCLPTSDRRVVSILTATERLSTYREYLAVCRRTQAYPIFRRLPRVPP